MKKYELKFLLRYGIITMKGGGFLTYFVSDIHGHHELFMKFLSKINFSIGDVMYVLGDIIDKGHDSIKLIKYMMSASNIHCIMGNHEHMLLSEYYALMEESPENFDEVLNALQRRFSDDEPLTFEMLDWLESLPYYIEGEDFIAVHAGVPTDEDGFLINPADALPEQLVFDRLFKEPTFAPKGEKCVIFGHTPTTYIAGKPKILAYKKKDRAGKSISDFSKIHIDTDTWGSKTLGCFCKEKLTVTYVKE